MNDLEYIPVALAAEQIGVTADTLYNWQKQGLVKIESSVNGDLILFSDFTVLREQLVNGTVNKLNKRANKKFSAESFIPAGLADDPRIIHSVVSLIKLADQYELSPDALLLGTALNLLKTGGLIRFRKEKDVIVSCLIKNPHLNQIIDNWPNNYSKEQFKRILPDILAVEIPTCSDFLGILYQSLQITSQKSRMGIYYTPLWLVKSMVDSAGKKNQTILDPCCGSGQFLLACAEFSKPENLFGCDIDLLAVLIAKLNLIMRFPNKEFEPQIFCLNAFTEIENVIHNDFDLVIGNPPWGCHFSADEKEFLKKKYPDIQSVESFSYFIELGLSHLKPTGVLSYLLPEAFLNTARHADIRKKLLKSNALLKIQELGKVFDGVTSLVIILEVSKQHKSEQKTKLISIKNEQTDVDQNEFLDSESTIISVNQNDEDRNLIKKIYQKPHITLKDQADWALGIVTGNNQQFLSTEKKENFEPIISGKNIKPFLIRDAENFLLFQPENLQQTAPESLYRTEEKLIYRFIGDRPVVAYDNQKRLTLNSANILIPKIPDYSLIIIMALFNSELYGYLYRKKFFSKKILRSHLEELPLPLMSDDELQELLDFANSYILTEDMNLLTDIDKFVYKLFDLEENEIVRITNN